jgi:hypothetical protein
MLSNRGVRSQQSVFALWRSCLRVGLLVIAHGLGALLA